MMRVAGPRPQVRDLKSLDLRTKVHSHEAKFGADVVELSQLCFSESALNAGSKKPPGSRHRRERFKLFNKILSVLFKCDVAEKTKEWPVLPSGEEWGIYKLTNLIVAVLKLRPTMVAKAFYCRRMV